MPKYQVKTDQGTYMVELDSEPESDEQLNSLVTQHVGGGTPAPKAEFNQLPQAAEPPLSDIGEGGGVGAVLNVAKDFAVETGKSFGRTLSGFQNIRPGIETAIENQSVIDESKAKAARDEFPDTSPANVDKINKAYSSSPITDILPGAVEEFGNLTTMAAPVIAGYRGLVARFAKQFPGLKQDTLKRMVGMALDDIGLASESSVKNMADSETLRASAGIDHITTAQASQEPGVIMAQRAATAKNPEFLNRVKGLEAEQNATLRKGLDDIPGVKRGEAGVNEVQSAVQKRKQASDLAAENLSRKAENFADTAKARVAAETETGKTQASNRTAELNARLEGKIKEAESVVEDVASAFPEANAVDPQKSGQVLRDKAAAMDKAFSKKAKEAYDTLDPEDEIKLEFESATAKAKEILAEAEPTEKIPKGIREIAGLEPEKPARKTTAGFIKPPAEEVVVDTTRTFNSVRQMRSDLKAGIREIRGANPHDTRLPKLYELESELKKVLDTSEDTEIGDQYRRISQWYMNETKRLRQGSVGDVLQPGARGEAFRQPDSSVAGAFFKSGKGAKEAAQEFKMAFGSDDEAMAAIRDVASRDLFMSARDSSGKLKSNSLAKWINKHNDALSEFPDLKREFTNIKTAQQNVDSVSGEVSAMRKTIAKEEAEGLKGLSKDESQRLKGIDIKQKAIGSKIDELRWDQDKSAAGLFLGDDADKAVGRIFRSANPNTKMKEAIDAVKSDPDAMRGLRRSVWDHLYEQTERRALDKNHVSLLNPEELTELMEKHKGLFRQLYTPDELKRTETIRDAIRMVQSTDKAQITGSQTAQLTNTSIAIETMLGKALGTAARTAMGPIKTTIEVISRTILGGLRDVSAERVKGLFEEALYDPKVAKALLDYAKTPNNKNALINLKLVAGMQAAIGTGRVIEESTNQKETK